MSKTNTILSEIETIFASLREKSPLKERDIETARNTIIQLFLTYWNEEMSHYNPINFKFVENGKIQIAAEYIEDIS